VNSGRETDGELSEEVFVTSEGLRAVLTLIAQHGPEGWRSLAIAGRLVAYTQRRFQPLAKAWGRDPADAAYAAFLAMRAKNVLTAEDPWGLVTHAVRLEIIAETHAERLLTSVDKASRPKNRPAELPIRTGGDREYLYDLAVPEPGATDTTDGAPHIEEIIRQAATFLALLGWPTELALTVVEYVSDRVGKTRSRTAAYDSLQRDTPARGNFGIDQTRWTAMLRLLIGTSGAPTGVFARLLLGDSLATIIADPDINATAVEVAW
jgi:hypothetical protein